MPDPCWDGASEDDGEHIDVVHWDLALRLADPDTGGELRRVSAEPGVLEVLGGPRLAGRRAADVGGGARSVIDHALKRQSREVRDVLRDGPIAALVVSPQGLAVRVLDQSD